MSLKDKLNAMLSCWTASPSPQHSELSIEFEEYTHLDFLLDRRPMRSIPR